MAPRKKIEVDTTALQAYRRGVAQRASDFKPVFRALQDELIDAHSRLFQTEGMAVGGWKPLDRDTFYEKRHKGYGANGILIRTGDLERSLTSRGQFPPMGIRDMSEKSMEYGTRVPYAPFHQMGTRNMHERQIVYVPRTFAAHAANKAAHHVAVGGPVMRLAGSMANAAVSGVGFAS